MARPRGRPKIVGKYSYLISYGNPQDQRTVVKHTASEVRAFVSKIYKGHTKNAERMCTPAEYAALIATIQSIAELRADDDHDFWSMPRHLVWSFQWGDQKKLTTLTTITRSENTA